VVAVFGSRVEISCVSVVPLGCVNMYGLTKEV
jgi:hypothetical protein